MPSATTAWPARQTLIAADVEVLEGGLLGDRLAGGPGDDELRGGGGNDRLEGEGGADTLIGDLGADTLEGGAGDDRLTQAYDLDGADTLIGGPDVDTADYSARTWWVHVDLDGIADDGTADEGDDVRADVERVIGTQFSDELSGAAGSQTLIGGGSDDILDGGPGADVLDGQSGLDTVTYAARAGAVTVDADAQTADDGETDEGDTIRPGVERLLGGSGADRLDRRRRRRHARGRPWRRRARRWRRAGRAPSRGLARTPSLGWSRPRGPDELRQCVGPCWPTPTMRRATMAQRAKPTRSAATWKC